MKKQEAEEEGQLSRCGIQKHARRFLKKGCRPVAIATASARHSLDHPSSGRREREPLELSSLKSEAGNGRNKLLKELEWASAARLTRGLPGRTRRTAAVDARAHERVVG